MMNCQNLSCFLELVEQIENQGQIALAKWLLEFLGIPRNKGVNFHGKFELGIPRSS